MHGCDTRVHAEAQMWHSCTRRGMNVTFVYTQRQLKHHLLHPSVLFSHSDTIVYSPRGLLRCLNEIHCWWHCQTIRMIRRRWSLVSHLFQPNHMWYSLELLGLFNLIWSEVKTHSYVAVQHCQGWGDTSVGISISELRRLNQRGWIRDILDDTTVPLILQYTL